jgi:hypothetical protein
MERLRFPQSLEQPLGGLDDDFFVVSFRSGCLFAGYRFHAFNLSQRSGSVKRRSVLNNGNIRRGRAGRKAGNWNNGAVEQWSK